MRRLMLTVGSVLMAQCSILSAPKPFERVETFLAGKQEGAAGTILGFKDTNSVTVTLSAPYPAVWAALKTVARKFDKVGGRPVTGIDEQSGRVQNGRITSDGLIGSQGGDYCCVDRRVRLRGNPGHANNYPIVGNQKTGSEGRFREYQL